MAAQKLSDLRLEAQQRSNQEIKTLVATSEWNRYINEAVAELYDLVISINPHYYVKSTPFTLSSVNTFDLTTVADWYKLRGIDYLPSTSGRPITLRPFNFAERNRQGYRAYALEGTNVMIMPTTNFAGNYTLWYTPTPVTLVNDTDTLDTILNVWSEFVAVTAAIAGAMKEESSLDGLGAQKQLLIDRINKAAANRDAEPAQAADLMTARYANDLDLWY